MTVIPASAPGECQPRRTRRLLLRRRSLSIFYTPKPPSRTKQHGRQRPGEGGGGGGEGEPTAAFEKLRLKCRWRVEDCGVHEGVASLQERAGDSNGRSSSSKRKPAKAGGPPDPAPSRTTPCSSLPAPAPREAGLLLLGREVCSAPPRPQRRTLNGGKRASQSMTRPKRSPCSLGRKVGRGSTAIKIVGCGFKPGG